MLWTIETSLKWERVQSPRKWFEDDSDEERKSKRKGKGKDEVQEPETLEDLEAMASGLLGR